MRKLKITKQITSRQTTSLDKYLNEVSKINLIGQEEEVQLAERIKKGDEAALEKLIKANLRFVISVAKQYQGRGLSLSELINEGNIGLVKAAKRFDETMGFKFISYAVWWIRQSIIQALAEQSRIVRLPLTKVDSINRINKTISKLEQEFNREPTNEEIAEIMGVSLDMVVYTRSLDNRLIYLEKPIKDNPEDGNLLDIIENEENKTGDFIHDSSLKIEVERALGTLFWKEKDVLMKYFGIGCKAKTLEEIGEEMNFTRERARQIKDSAIRRLKNSKRSKHLKEFLG